LSTLPESIGKLSSLQKLDLRGNKLTTLPWSIGDLKSLQTLDLGGNKSTTLPESITKLESLQTLSLSYNRFTTLPESISNLKSLQTLDLGGNKSTTLPESISKLTSLQELKLWDNKLSTLPESIGSLSSLKTLNLSSNEFSTLPEFISNLKSLKTLDLAYNELTTLPESFSQLKALTNLNLRGNPWEGEWEGIEKDEIPRVLELCWQRAPITVFISHSRKDEGQYLANDITQNLKKRNEIREVYVSGAQQISESQLFLFIATEYSINNEQCQQELELAVTRDIPIIPIKATEIKWEDLSKIDLRVEFSMSEKLGFELEFNGEKGKEKEFHDGLYEYIKKYKREVNLFKTEERKVDEQWRNFKIIGEKLIESENFRKKLIENREQFKNLSEELKTKKISLVEYIFKWGQILNSKSK